MAKTFSYYIEDDGENIYYNFLSPHATYSVYFKPNEYTHYIEEYPFLLENAYGFGFFQFPHQPKGRTIPIDNKIRSTIELIIRDFLFARNKNALLLYHCDFSDGRQGKRSKAFHRWYNASMAKTEVEKEEIELLVSNNSEDADYTTHYIGYLCPKDNPKAAIAHKEFEDFAANLVLDPK